MTVRRPPPPPVYTQAQCDDYEERAAILEFEAGMTREEAEALYVLLGKELKRDGE